MPALRNGLNISLGNISITPAITTAETVSQENISAASSIAVTTDAGTTATTFTNLAATEISQNVTTTSNVPSSTRLNATKTVMNPLAALRGKISFPSAPNPVSVPSNEVPLNQAARKIQEQTLSLDRYARTNGITIKTTANIRPDLLAATNFKPFYQTLNLNTTNFGSYLSDLYRASTLQDTIRRYTLATKNQDRLGPLLSAVNNNVINTIDKTQTTIANLDNLISIYRNLKSALDVKATLGGRNQTEPNAPLLKLPDFFTDKMLFSAEAYNSFADTKIVYQLIADLTNILSLCSFNLLDNFRDLERLQSPVNAPQGSVVDPITIDTTYGTGLRYTPRSISNVVVTNYTTYNNIVNVLPSETDNKIKFLINLLSKEFRVSYGLGTGNQLTTERTFFGFGSSGNPFQFVNGTVPPDVFVAPNGANSLSSLFYQQIEGNAVVLPLEARQVAGDGETIFVPGIEYYGDGILNNNLVAYETYRDRFSSIYNFAKNVYDGLLLEQGQQTNSLLPASLLQNATKLFKLCQDQFRPNGINSDSTSVLIYVLFLLSSGNPNLKFEVYNLLILLILYNQRTEVTLTQVTINQFRDNLFNEVSNSSINGQIVTEQNLETLVRAQINVVRSLFEKSVQQSPNINNSVDSTGDSLRSQITVALEQFSSLNDSLKDSRCGANLLKSVTSFAKTMFDVCSVNNESIHLNEGSTSTRYNNLTMTGFLLLAFETFSSFVKKFSTNVVLSLQNDQLTVDYNLDTQTVDDFLNGTATNQNILSNYDTKLREEDQVITNILEFFRLMNSSFSGIATQQVGNLNFDQLRELGVRNLTLGSIRVAKNVFKTITDKIRTVNPVAKNMEFYIPSGKYVSEANWYATKIALADPKLRTLNKQKIITVGIPKGFLDAALGARLSRNAVAGNALNIEVSDLINVKVFKLGKNDEGLIYNPISFKFDMSLFPYGFDGTFPLVDNAPSSNDTYATLLDKFQFYDFDESVSYSNVVPKTLRGNNQGQVGFQQSDPFYITRQEIAVEVINNLYTSFILDNYLNVLSGLNFNEETFVEYDQKEIIGFNTAMRAYQAGDLTQLVNVKNMSSPYQQFLNFFTDKNEQKLMLTICNDIEKTVFKPKMYDRTFHIIFDPSKFSIDVNATRQTPGGNNCLTNLLTTNQIEENNGLLYRKSESFELLQYFISVEIIS